MNIVRKGVWPRPHRDQKRLGRTRKLVEPFALPDETAAAIAAQWELPLCLTLAGYEPLAAQLREFGVR